MTPEQIGRVVGVFLGVALLVLFAAAVLFLAAHLIEGVADVLRQAGA